MGILPYYEKEVKVKGNRTFCLNPGCTNVRVKNLFCSAECHAEHKRKTKENESNS